MSGRSIRLPGHFLAIAEHHYRTKNPYRGRVEQGGFLFSDPATPETIAGATGPGDSSEHAEASVYLAREDVEPHVQAAGYVLVGCWHTHPEAAGVEPSPSDREAWRSDLRRSPRLDSWASVVLIRNGDRSRWRELAGWRTTRRDCRPATVTPGLSDATRELAGGLDWIVNRTALVKPLRTWAQERGRLRRDLALLDEDAALVERVRRRELDARLERLGIRGRLTTPAQPPHTASEPAGQVISGDGTTIRRYFTPPKITIR